MIKRLIHFVDVSIPGLSGRDLTRSTAARITGRKLRRDMGRIDSEILRDIGLDRSAA